MAFIYDSPLFFSLVTASVLLRMLQLLFFRFAKCSRFHVDVENMFLWRQFKQTCLDNRRRCSVLFTLAFAPNQLVTFGYAASLSPSSKLQFIMNCNGITRYDFDHQQKFYVAFEKFSRTFIECTWHIMNVKAI